MGDTMSAAIEAMVCCKSVTVVVTANTVSLVLDLRYTDRDYYAALVAAERWMPGEQVDELSLPQCDVVVFDRLPNQIRESFLSLR